MTTVWACTTVVKVNSTVEPTTIADVTVFATPPARTVKFEGSAVVAFSASL